MLTASGSPNSTVERLDGASYRRRPILVLGRLRAPSDAMWCRFVAYGGVNMNRLSSALARILGVKHVAIGPLVLIGVVAGVAALAFAFTGGWLSPDRLTPEKVVDVLSERGGNPIGHRRNHAKGICFTGTFGANGAGARLSTAPMLAAGSYPVIGRFAIAVGNPEASDVTGRVRSMAIDVITPDGQEWRTGMNNMPVFVASTPEAFYELTVASDIVPATGQPDPAAIQRYVAAHPEFAAFGHWAQTAPWTASYTDEDYNSLNAFRFVDARGVSRAVRWSMHAEQPARDTTPAELAKLGPDFLAQDLRLRLGQGALRWHLMVTVAGPGDATNDATRQWPADREQVDVGTLIIQQTQDEANGPCRDVNYDPLILPAGIRPSDDPLLAARSSTYANSFDRRTAEAVYYPQTPSKPAEAAR
jgi:catalase